VTSRGCREPLAVPPGSQHHTTGPRRGPPPLPAHRVRLPHPRPTPHPPHPHISLTHSWSGVRIPLRAPLHNPLSLNGLCRRKQARNARIFTLTTAHGDKLVTNWEPAAKPGAGARRAIFPHGKARRGRRLAPSTEEQRGPVGKGPPPAGDSLKANRRSRMLPPHPIPFRSRSRFCSWLPGSQSCHEGISC
jgi:hypothetical protein